MNYELQIEALGARWIVLDSVLQASMSQVGSNCYTYEHMRTLLNQAKFYKQEQTCVSRFEPLNNILKIANRVMYMVLAHCVEALLPLTPFVLPPSVHS